MSRREKVIIIGIDGLEPAFVETLKEKGISRGFAYFYENGIVARMRSTFPPDTVLAWPTIYTGLIHQRFGLEPEPESIFELQIKSLNVRRKLMGKTFWDIASHFGKRVCVVNPIFGYPPWHVNGIMASGPSFGLHGSPLSIPARDDLKGYKLGTYGKTPLLLHEYKEMYNEALKQLLDMFKLTTILIDEEDYDLVFTADYTLDRIQHYFWRFDNEDDPCRPKLINPYKGLIERYYMLIDRLVTYYVERYGDDYTVVVLGDHGHTGRPARLLSVEKILNVEPRLSTISVLRDIAYLLAFYSHMDAYAYKVIRYLQSIGKLRRILLGNEKNFEADGGMIKTLKQFGLKEYVGIRFCGEKKGYKGRSVSELLTRVLSDLDMVDFIMTPKEYYGVEDVEYEADLYLKLKGFGNYPEANSLLAHPLHRSGSHLVAYSLLGGQRQAQLPFPMELKDI
ncbi:MAG: alkaline phosphatase family protein [Candidatus Korarchaeota archaeon]|nr:alkaline phosphatase family protein [Candidatus Korarchaeota archaeon]